MGTERLQVGDTVTVALVRLDAEGEHIGKQKEPSNTKPVRIRDRLGVWHTPSGVVHRSSEPFNRRTDVTVDFIPITEGYQKYSGTATFIEGYRPGRMILQADEMELTGVQPPGRKGYYEAEGTNLELRVNVRATWANHKDLWVGHWIEKNLDNHVRTEWIFVIHAATLVVQSLSELDRQPETRNASAKEAVR